MIRKLPWAEIIVTVLVLAAGAGVFLYAHRNEGSLEESKQRGADIVGALAEYHAEHDTYPDRLAQLAPSYIPAIQPPTWGLKRWHYRRYTPGDVGAQHAAPADGEMYFQLSVAADESGYPVLYYDLPAQRWVLNN